MLEKVIIFIVFLCPLIFFHELGHFLFARLFGVRVEVFSLGFGPKFLKWKRKDTEYALSIIPLGGYVKMYGDDPLNGDQVPEDQRQFAFTHKSKWARFWIVLGGPLANFILAFVLFFLLLMTGEKVPEAKFGYIKNNTELFRVGLRTGDVIKKINSAEVVGISDLALEGDKITSLDVQRGLATVHLAFERDYKTFMDDFLNLSPRFRTPILANGNGERFAISYEADKVNWTNSLDEMAENTHANLYLFPLLNPKDVADHKVDMTKVQTIVLNQKSPEDFYTKVTAKGFYPLDLVVSSIVMGSPADKAHVREGDLILTLNNQFYSSFEEIRETIQQVKANEAVNLFVQRGTETVLVSVIPEEKTVNGLKMKSVGVYSAGDYVPMQYVQSPGKGLITSFTQGLFRTWDSIEKTVDGFKKLITNEVSLKSIGGPLAIGKVASDSLNISLSYFFRLMALISVNLGVINLFPIPVLDGGHIMFLGFEVINRGPLSKRKMQIAQQFGVSLLFMLIFVALFNDISRLF
ncbi:MAG: RIP metalloprotease RseP [Bacteriovoracaceae bacterium]